MRHIVKYAVAALYFWSTFCHAYVVNDETAANQIILFHWSIKDPKYGDIPYETPSTVSILHLDPPRDEVVKFGLSFSGGNERAIYHFWQPKGATDWHQRIITTEKDGTWTSEVFGAHLVKGVWTPDGLSSAQLADSSPWDFYDLSRLPNIDWKIPDLGPALPGTLYAAVNLDLYMRNNPLGFNSGNWRVGQRLRDIGASIVNGQSPGLDGIYWATTPFVFDSNPAGYGFVPTGGIGTLYNSTGSEVVMASHTPEPSGYLMLIAGLAILGALRVTRNKLV